MAHKFILRFEPEMFEKIRRLAEKERRSIHAQIMKILEWYLASIESD